MADVYVCESCAKRETVQGRLADNPKAVQPGTKVWLFPVGDEVTE